MGSTIISILFALPLLTYARIRIDVTMNKMEPGNFIRISGNIQEPLTEQDVMDFHLNEDNLKDAIRMHFGERPDEVYTMSGTPYGDLYTIFGWNEVTKMMKPVRAKVLSVTAKPMAVDSQIYMNKDDKEKIINIPISYEVQNMIMSKWAMDLNIIVNDNIVYSFDIANSSMADGNMMRYVQEFGKNFRLSKPVMFGEQSGMEMTLQPKQKVIAEMYVNKEVMAIQVDYETSLMGTVAVGYSKGFRGHRFWSADVKEVMKSMKQMMKMMKVPASEMLEVSYFAEPRVVIRDFYTSEVLYSIPMMI